MSFVYFIGERGENPDAIKIGFTSDHPKRRIKSLRTGCPYPLGVHAFVCAPMSLESVLHNAFAPVRLHGEWFSMVGELRQLVADMRKEKGGEAPHTEDQFFVHVNRLLGPENHNFTKPMFYRHPASSVNLSPLWDWWIAKIDVEVEAHSRILARQQSTGHLVASGHLT